MSRRGRVWLHVVGYVIRFVVHDMLSPSDDVVAEMAAAGSAAATGEEEPTSCVRASHGGDLVYIDWPIVLTCCDTTLRQSRSSMSTV